MSGLSGLDLDDRLVTFVENQVAEGRFTSAAEVVGAALKLLEERESKLAALRQALVEGETSGEPEPFDFDAFISAKRGTYASKP